MHIRSILNSHQSIRNRLITWFLLIALIPVGWITTITYLECKRILIDQATKHLKTVTKRQERLLDFYFDEKKLHANIISNDPTILQATQELDHLLAHEGKTSPLYQKTALTFYPILALQMKAFDYRDLWLINPKGTLIFAVSSPSLVSQNILQESQYAALKTVVEKSLSSLQTQIISFIFHREKNNFISFIVIPLLTSDHQLVGIALAEMDNTALYQMLPGYNELGLTHLLVIAQLGNHFFSVNPSLTEKTTSKEIDFHSPFGQFIQQALAQSDIVTADVEFEDRQHLMVGIHFHAAFNWILVTVIDIALLLKPIYQLKYLFAILVMTTAFAVILAASHVAHKIASPILTLTEKTNVLASGDLSQRITITSQDEIGKLGQSFNLMASKLNHLINHLDELVAKRTKDYETQNIKLEQTIKELHQTRDRLITQEKLASLGALTAGIAHEIKNPLNFIMNFAELGLQVEKDIEEQVQRLKSFLSQEDQEELKDLFGTLQLNISKILEHGKRADNIIFNMLQHSRGTPGEKQATPIQKLLDEDIALSYHGMRAQNASFHVVIEKNYDPSVSTITVVPQEISRVILNLLNNAYYSIFQKTKHPPSTPYQPTVKISLAREANFVVIKIWDNGLGISPQVLSKLFTPFFTTKPPGEGTGLGLSLSYNIIVQGHGGMLSVQSQPGEFAEFKIVLPDSKYTS